MNKHLVSSSLLILALAADRAHADDIETTLRVDEVTVYPRTAAVTRRGEVNLPAGEHRLIVRGLPDPVDAGSLRLSAGSRAVRLGGVELERIVATDFVNDAESALAAKLLALEDQRAAVQDEIPTAETQLKLIESLAGPSADGDDTPRSGTVELAGTLAAMASGAADARTKIRAAKITIRGLDSQIAATKAELDKVRTAKKSTTEVRATVFASTAVTTARPAADAAAPRVASLFLSLQDFAPSAANAGLEEIIVTATRSRGRAPSDAPQAEEAPRITAESFATEFVAEYRIPGRVSIGADRQARIYPISEEEFEPELVARAVLPAGPDARLGAAFDYGGDVPINAGRVQLYRDGAYVGAAALPLLLPGAEVRVPFGIDERIRIVVRDERTESGARGVANRQVLDEQRRRYEITSYHATAMPIEIIDRVPVPMDSGIEVEVLDGATPPTQRDLDGKAGVYLWRLDGVPQQTETIRHYYSVRYPSDSRLAATEGGN